MYTLSATTVIIKSEVIEYTLSFLSHANAYGKCMNIFFSV